MAKKHEIATLPKWAQEHIRALEMNQRVLQEELHRTRTAHGVLCERTGWFTIPGPSPDEAKQDPMVERNLWYLSNSGAHSACRLYPGDVLLVGRAIERIDYAEGERISFLTGNEVAS